jgi:hypothetical protein
LKALIDKAIEKKRIGFKMIKTDNKIGDKYERGDNIVEIEEEEPDMLNAEIDYSDYINPNTKNTKENQRKNKENEETKINEESIRILKSDIPAEEWERELEKVSSKLKVNYTENYSISSGIGEWKGRFDQMKTNNNVLLINKNRVLERISQRLVQY